MEKAEFRNDSPGVCGATIVQPGGKIQGVAVKPGETIWLTEEDQIETANAPRKAEDNPFINGTLNLVTEPKDIANRRPIGHTERPQAPVSEEDQAAADAKRQENEAASAEHARKEQEEAARREEQAQEAKDTGPKPLPHQGQRDPAEETGVVVEPNGPAPEGERAVAEETATPDAEPKKAAPKPAPVKAAK